MSRHRAKSPLPRWVFWLILLGMAAVLLYAMLPDPR